MKADCQHPVIKTPIVVAHRGASHDAPENTLPAFKLAWKQEADAIECDIRLTQDGHIICLHDEHTGRVANRKLNAAASSLKQIQSIDVGKKFSPEYKGTKVPTLPEVFETVPAAGQIYVEIKCGPEVSEPLIKAVDESDLSPDQITFISFSAEVLKAIKSIFPQYSTALLCSLKRNLNGSLSPSAPDALHTLRNLQAHSFSTDYKNLSKDYVQTLISNGYAHYAWTVDDPEIATALISWGTSSITTNEPAKVRQLLSSKLNP